MNDLRITRRHFGACAAGALTAAAARADEPAQARKAQVAITLDLEMSREYPRRGMTEWDYEKGNLDEATKLYAVRAAETVQQRGGRIHFFCVGRTLEQPDVEWLKRLAAAGHPIGNHTYDHVNVKAMRPEETQFRFRRAPWLVEGRSAAQVIRDNIRLTSLALEQRVGVTAAGFRTPGGFANGLADRPDVQQMLLELGFTWASSKYPAHASGQDGRQPAQEVYDSIVAAQAESQPFVYPSGLIEVPMSPISDVTAFRSKHWKLPWFLRAIELAVTRAIRTGGVFDFLAHPSCLVVEDPQLETIKLICDLVKAAGDRAELTDLATLARRTQRKGTADASRGKQ
jgi:peptidoglycan/xylan/chitin deacetylase (PgdA/CDA1 family)